MPSRGSTHPSALSDHLVRSTYPFSAHSHHHIIRSTHPFSALPHRHLVPSLEARSMALAIRHPKKLEEEEVGLRDDMHGNRAMSTRSNAYCGRSSRRVAGVG